MSTSSKTLKVKEKKAHREWPAVVYFGTIGGGFLGYTSIRIILDGYPHPLHWASGLAGALIGLGGSWLWFRWRGDII